MRFDADWLWEFRFSEVALRQYLRMQLSDNSLNPSPWLLRERLSERSPLRWTLWSSQQIPNPPNLQRPRHLHLLHHLLRQWSCGGIGELRKEGSKVCGRCRKFATPQNRGRGEALRGGKGEKYVNGRPLPIGKQRDHTECEWSCFAGTLPIITVVWWRRRGRKSDTLLYPCTCACMSSLLLNINLIYMH